MCCSVFSCADYELYGVVHGNVCREGIIGGIGFHVLHRFCSYHFVMQIYNYFISPRKSLCGFLFHGISECFMEEQITALGTPRYVSYMASSAEVEAWKVLVEVLNSNFGRAAEREVVRLALTVAQKLLVVLIKLIKIEACKVPEAKE